MLALADQQLLTGSAIIIAGYFRATKSTLVNTDLKFEYRIREPHFHLILYLSCLSSSSHLASIITLQQYFAAHRLARTIRVWLIYTFAVLLAISITYAQPFSMLHVGALESPINWGRPEDRCMMKNASSTCNDNSTFFAILRYLIVFIIFYFAIISPFWIAAHQISPSLTCRAEPGTPQARFRAFFKRHFAIQWKPARMLSPKAWLRRLSESLERCEGSGPWSRFVRATPRKVKSTRRKLTFGTPTLLFYSQLLLMSISLTYTLAQKVAEPSEDWLCGLNDLDANTWNFGQFLPLILLGQLVFAGVGGFTETLEEHPNLLDGNQSTQASSTDNMSLRTIHHEAESSHEDAVSNLTIPSPTPTSRVSVDAADSESRILLTRNATV
ncbi:hypothetical protein BC567DRAFT_14888 [Phyllosticta citribraziliensis]